MNNELSPQLQPVANAMAATAVSQTLSFCMERKYLEEIATNNAVFQLRVIPQTLPNEVSWIAVKQIGRPLEKSAESCFTAIQKILYSCFLPKEYQLLFLVIGDGKESRLYLGLRDRGQAMRSKSMTRSLNEFLKGIWPGLQTSLTTDSDSFLSQFKEDIANDTFENVYALTGIPSMESQYKSIYPATIDKLIAGMNRSKHFAYMVVADPIPTNEVEDMLFQCREMNGQAESMKSMNVSEGLSNGITSSVTTGHSVSHTSGTNESINRKDFTRLGKAAMTATGLGMAASVFPAAGNVLNGCANAAGALTAAATNLLGFGMIGSVISNLMPQKTVGTSESDTESYSSNLTQGESETRTQTISRNIVSKHIEAVSEHLFYHGQRLEAGKAIGLWKVGVYLMADRKADLQGGALQLRSMLSGQESIFEPVRIHDISDVLEKPVGRQCGATFREYTLGQFSSPLIAVDDANGKPFEHPLGENYKELKTVLTTKELSYLINFPLRSVPGISVVDSSPEFSLNRQALSDGTPVIEFGKLLYGGTDTDIDYQLTVNGLAKHTLLSGINGTGKTNTVQAILNNLSGRVPFLIIEPAKTEYVDWAIEYNKKNPSSPISIYIPGCKSYKDKSTRENIKITPLKLNPFEVVWLDKDQEPNVLSHIDRLKSSFAAAFPMYDILPVLMEDLIYTIYQNKSSDWLTEPPVFGRTLPPTLNGMSVTVEQVIKNRGYEERIERNMKACLNTRIDSLKRGWKGEMLNTLHSTPWQELFGKPCIINLSYVGDDVDKSFFMALILQFLYEYRSAQADVGYVDFNDNSCKHLTIIEEAHRVMMKCENPELPQYKSAMMFSNMLSEIRAYGEGMFLVDQVPTRLIPDAIKNTNTKITHRLVAEDDVKAIAESMGVSKEQQLIIPKLQVGQCLVSTSLSPDKHWIKVNKVK